MALKRHMSLGFALGVMGTLAALTEPAYVAQLWNPRERTRSNCRSGPGALQCPELVQLRSRMFVLDGAPLSVFREES
jgi:hypothetical protein